MAVHKQNNFENYGKLAKHHYYEHEWKGMAKYGYGAATYALTKFFLNFEVSLESQQAFGSFASLCSDIMDESDLSISWYFVEE